MRKLDFEKTMADFTGRMDIEDCPKALQPYCGVYGFCSFESVQLMEDVVYEPSKLEALDTPILQYDLFRFVLVFDHFRDILHVMELVPEGEESRIHEIQDLLRHTMSSGYSFEVKGEVVSNLSDEQFLEMIEKGKTHVKRGDVFQVVLSRKFKQSYVGDEFQVYRKLRTINPSPYLFYFDLGNTVIMGSSPEAHLVVNERQAEIHPIAGTYPRSGNDQQDAQDALKLARDPKEQAEHTMLVDLARNDLNRHCENVKVDTLQEVQFFSHVIHLVSKVTGEIHPEGNVPALFGGTFPAGTLSGAPKHMALNIIKNLEPDLRGPYGGAIGMFGFFGHCQHAIIIRSFVAKNHQLISQAGAGVVLDSEPQKELEEVHHKLSALSKTIQNIQDYEGIGS
ncbi:MAG: anthranilate synthase component I family protein, partial [Bacteroidota bacterium]